MEKSPVCKCPTTIRLLILAITERLSNMRSHAHTVFVAEVEGG